MSNTTSDEVYWWHLLLTCTTKERSLNTSCIRGGCVLQSNVLHWLRQWRKLSFTEERSRPWQVLIHIWYVLYSTRLNWRNACHAHWCYLWTGNGARRFRLEMFHVKPCRDALCSGSQIKSFLVLQSVSYITGYGKAIPSNWTVTQSVVLPGV